MTEKERASSEAIDGLQMAPELILDLARKAAELLVERIKNLPIEDAWDGDFRQELEDQLMEDPPEDGQPAVEVIERANSSWLSSTGSGTGLAIQRVRAVFSQARDRAR